jgi:endonuclease/exonuclease/phosphatase family metal-dependent hydrolase
MRCMTQNIWNYNRQWRRRLQMIADQIRQEQPDVVCLQETRHDFRYHRGVGQGEQLAEITGYYPTIAIGQVYSRFPRVDEGLTILTRDPPLRSMLRRLTRFRRRLRDGNQRICLGVTIENEGIEVDVYTSHFSLSPKSRLINAREVVELIDEQSGDRPAILMGDLNSPPDTPSFQILVGPEGGFVDCWHVAHPDELGFTTDSWRPHDRIDYIMVRNFPGCISSVRLIGDKPVSGIYPSDHFGLVVDLQPDSSSPRE